MKVVWFKTWNSKDAFDSPSGRVGIPVEAIGHVATGFPGETDVFTFGGKVVVQGTPEQVIEAIRKAKES